MFLTIFALVALVGTAGASVEAALGLRTVPRLEGLPEEDSDFPFVSIVVAARNEQKNIRAALSSLLHLDYPRKEIVVVNDRSTDRTGEILRDMAAEAALRIVTVKDLPPGWLGKNHAQFQGAAASHGDLILFTDADVVMDPSVLKRAVHHMNVNRLDHLTISPRAAMPGTWLNVFIVGFAVFFNLFTRPWKVSDPESCAHIGIGAFNLIRRAAYEKIGTHRTIAMRPDDDLKLGKLVKKTGLRQRFVFGAGMIEVEWYDSVRALVDGLMKNSFAGADYSLSLITAGLVALLFFIAGPYFGALFAHGPTRWLCLATAVIWTMSGAAAARVQKLPALYGLGMPLAAILFAFIIAKATLRTLVRGGIEWRGTFYSLKELKKNRI